MFIVIINSYPIFVFQEIPSIAEFYQHMDSPISSNRLSTILFKASENFEN